LNELKFVIFHRYSNELSGHFYAYSKFKGKWHYFNDLDYDGYAIKKNPPLLKDFSENIYPVCFFYVRSEKYNKNLEDCQII
jgi:hypothetical protein